MTITIGGIIMYSSFIMLPHEANIKIGDKVKMLPNKKLEENVQLYGFELNEDINYDDYCDCELTVLEISYELIRVDFKVVMLKVETEYEDGEQAWLYYQLEVVPIEGLKGLFTVELL